MTSDRKPTHRALLTEAGAKRLGVALQPVDIRVDEDANGIYATDIWSVDGERIGGNLDAAAILDPKPMRPR